LSLKAGEKENITKKFKRQTVIQTIEFDWKVLWKKKKVKISSFLLT